MLFPPGRRPKGPTSCRGQEDREDKGGPSITNCSVIAMLAKLQNPVQRLHEILNIFSQEKEYHVPGSNSGNAR